MEVYTLHASLENYCKYIFLFSNYENKTDMSLTRFSFTIFMHLFFIFRTFKLNLLITNISVNY